MTVKLKRLAEILKNKYVLAGLTVVLALVIAYLTETLYFNYGRFIPDRMTENDEVEISTANLTINEDGTYETTGEDTGIISLNFKPSYIYKMSLVLSVDRPEAVDYSVQSGTGDGVVDRTTYPEFKSGEPEIAVLNTVCDQVSIFFFTDTPAKVSLDDYGFDYDFTFNWIHFWSIFVLAFVILIVIWPFFGFYRFSYPVSAALIIVVIGILLSYLVPFSYTWDEHAHFLRAYYLSEGVFDVDDDATAVFPYHLEYENNHDYRSIEDYNKYLQEIEDLRVIPDTERHIETTANTYLFLPYLTGGAAIFLGRLFGLNFYYLNILARISNVLLYAALIFLSLILFPSNKKLFFFLALIPNMFLAAVSPGPGAWLSGFMFLTVAVIAYIKEKKVKIGWLQFILLLILFLFITIGRMTYGFFFCLIFLIPRDRFKGKVLKLVYPVVTLVLMAGSMIYVYRYSSNIGLSTFGRTDVNVSKQLDFMISHPLRFLRIALSFTFNLFLADAFGIYPGDLANVGTLVPVLSTLATLFLLVISLCGNNKRLVFNNLKDRILITVLSLVSLGATEAAMYVSFSKVSATYLAGFQGRYVYVVFILFLTILQGKYFKFNYNPKIVNAVNVSFVLLLISQMIFLILRYCYT